MRIYFTKRMRGGYYITCFAIILQVFVSAKVQAQCSGCTTVISSNALPVYTVNPGQTLCVNAGFNYTGTIILNGGTLCNNGTLSKIQFLEGTFNNFGSYDASAAVTISNTNNLTINNFAGKINFKAVDILSAGATYSVTLNVNNNSQVSFESDVTASKGSLVINNAIAALPPGTKVVIGGGDVSGRSIINFGGSFVVDGTANLTLANYSIGTLNITKSFTLDGKGTKTVANYGVMNVGTTLNITGNGQNTGNVVFNNLIDVNVKDPKKGNGAVLNVKKSFTVDINNAVVQINNSGSIIVGTSYTQSKPDVSLTNKGTFTAGQDVTLDKGKAVNYNFFQARDININNAPFENNGQTITDRDFNLNTSGSTFTNNAYLQVQRTFYSKGTVTLAPSTLIQSANFTNDNQGIVNGPASISGDNSKYANIIISNNSSNTGFLNGYIVIWDQTINGQPAVRLDNYNNANRIGPPVIYFPPCGNNVFITISPSNPIICPGQSVALTASAFYQVVIHIFSFNIIINVPLPGIFTWQPAAAITGPNTGSTIIAHPSVSTNFTVTGLLFSGSGLCTKSASTLVTVDNVMANAGLPRTIYPSVSTILGGLPAPMGGTTPTASGGVGSYSYAWSPSSAIPANAANPSAAPTVTTTYIVTVTDAIGCIAKSTVIVTVTNPEYAVMTKQLDGQAYQPYYGNIYFTLDGEYSNTALNYTIYNYARQNVSSAALSPTTYNVGDNRYTINIGALITGSYVLEVKNEKNELRYLRFKK